MTGQDLADWYRSYTEAFGDVAAGRRTGIDPIVACFATPVILTTADAHVVLGTPADVIANLVTPQVEALRAAGFDRITFSRVEGQVVNGRAGIVDADFTRWDTAGRELSSQRAVYYLVRPADAWRIAAIAVGSPA